MQVTVHLQADPADGLRGGRPVASPARELARAAEELGIGPLLPAAGARAGPPTILTVEVPDLAAAERVVARLRRVDGVVAVYVKPADQLP